MIKVRQKEQDKIVFITLGMIGGNNLMMQYQEEPESIGRVQIRLGKHDYISFPTDSNKIITKQDFIDFITHYTEEYWDGWMEYDKASDNE